jgi:hypothetical protein
MCLTQAVTVLAIEPDAVRVILDGREQRLQNLLVPDVRPGELVVVGLGQVLGRPIAAAGIPAAAVPSDRSAEPDIRPPLMD